MKKFNQKGMAHMAMLLVILIIAAVGGGGYYVYHKHHKSTKPIAVVTPASKELKLNKNKVLLAIPKGWTAKQDLNRSTRPCDSVATSSVDFLQTCLDHATVTLDKSASGKYPLEVSINVYSLTNKSDTAKQWFDKDLMAGVSGKTITGLQNGFTGYTAEDSSSEALTEYHVYTHGGIVVYTYARLMDKGQQYDYSSYKDDVTSMSSFTEL